MGRNEVFHLWSRNFRSSTTFPRFIVSWCSDSGRKDADFDTDVHEAVAMVPGMGEDKKGKVIDCLQEGYKLNDKVIRHAKVAVGQ